MKRTRRSTHQTPNSTDNYSQSAPQSISRGFSLKTHHIALVGLLLVALANGENIRSFTAKNEATGTRKAAHKERLKLDKERARDAKDMSQVALERYRQNCIMVVDQATRKEVYFAPGLAVLDTGLGRSVRDGAAVCNRLGDTALIVNGVMEELASVTADDLDQLTAVLDRRGYRIATPAPETPIAQPSARPIDKPAKASKTAANPTGN